MPGSARRAKKRAYNDAIAAQKCKPITTFFQQSESESVDLSTLTTATTTTSATFASEREPNDTETSTTPEDFPATHLDIQAIQPSPAVSSKHVTGRNAVLSLNFDWLLIRDMIDDSNKPYPVLFCKLCQKHKTKTANGSMAWVTEGYKLLRKDKVKDHAKSEQHKQSLMAEKLEEQMNSQEEHFSEKQLTVAQCLTEIVFYIVKKNLPLDLFGSLVDLCIKTGSEALKATRQGLNATYTSPESVHELLQAISDSTDETLLPEIRDSLSYGLMLDEVCDLSVTKNLGMVIKYISKTGEPSMKFLVDKEMVRSTGTDIKNTTLAALTEKELDVTRCTNLTSDGASSFTGKHNGAATLLKRDGGMEHAVVMHCHDHRLALACRDAFAEIPQLDPISEGLDSLFKFYKYSSVSAATLRNLQELYQQPKWKIQQAKHHRWLSYDKAVTAVLKGINVITEDLENASSKESTGEFSAKHKTDATALLKWLTSEKNLRMLCLLGDILPHLADLSLLFQRRSVDITYIQPKLQSTLAILEKCKTEPGAWERKLLNNSGELAVVNKRNCSEQQFNETIRVPFLTGLIKNIEIRFDNIDVVSMLAALEVPLDVIDDLPPVFRENLIRDLANKFSLDELTVLQEWVGWLELLKNLSFPENERGSNVAMLGKLLTQRDSASSKELSSTYPNLAFLYSVVNTLALSSAEVERLFSHLKIIKRDRRTSLSNKCLNWILNVKLNVDDELADAIKSSAVQKWLKKKKRRFFVHNKH